MKIVGPIFLGITGALALTACEAPIRDQTYAPTALATETQEQAWAECQFQVEAATASIGTGRSYRNESFDDILGDAVADGIIEGEEQNSLFVSCMRSKGFQRT